MIRGLAAEAALLPSKEVLEALKLKYVSSTKFNVPGVPIPLQNDDVILKTNLGIKIHETCQYLAGSLDGDFNEDCVVEFKNGINFNLTDLPAVLRGNPDSILVQVGSFHRSRIQ